MFKHSFYELLLFAVLGLIGAITSVLLSQRKRGFPDDKNIWKALIVDSFAGILASIFITDYFWKKPSAIFPLTIGMSGSRLLYIVKKIPTNFVIRNLELQDKLNSGEYELKKKNKHELEDTE